MVTYLILDTLFYTRPGSVIVTFIIRYVDGTNNTEVTQLSVVFNNGLKHFNQSNLQIDMVNLDISIDGEYSLIVIIIHSY